MGDRVSMTVWMVRFLFLIVFLTLLYFSQRFWIVRSRRRIARVQHPKLRFVLRWLWIGAVSLFLLLLAQRVAGIAGWPSSHQEYYAWSSILLALWLGGSIVSYLAVQVVRGAGKLWRIVAAALRRLGPRSANVPDLVDGSRRYFLRTATFAAGALPFAAAVYGFAAERFRYTVRRVEVPITGLPPALDGLRIAQLSDIHISDYMPRGEIARAVDLANQLDAELVAVTGDLLTGPGDPLEQCVKELGRLRAALGVWGCNGNHEIYADAEDAAEELFRQHGMQMLRQQNTELTWRGMKFNLIGVDYQRQHSWSGERLEMLRGVEALIRRDMPNILLSHNPNAFDRARELGIELTLAGHTHGGQVKVEILDHRFTPARFITAYPAGLYQRSFGAGAGKTADASPRDPGGHASLYVNRGLGTIGIPVRLGVPPEITLLTLRRA